MAWLMRASLTPKGLLKDASIAGSPSSFKEVTRILQAIARDRTCMLGCLPL